MISEFKEELLEFLLTHTGKMMEINFLSEKYCGNQVFFDIGDLTLVRCHLGLNQVLSELKEMKWINIHPAWGYSASHRQTEDHTKSYLTQIMVVKARLTTLGELEYKKSKEMSKPSLHIDNSIKIGRDLKGKAITGSVKANIDDPDPLSKKNYSINKKILFVSILAVIVAIILYLVQR